MISFQTKVRAFTGIVICFCIAILVAKHTCAYYPDCVTLQTAYSIRGEVSHFVPSWAAGLTERGGAFMRDNMFESTKDRVIYEVLQSLAYWMSLQDRVYVFTAVANLFIFV